MPISVNITGSRYGVETEVTGRSTYNPSGGMRKMFQEFGMDHEDILEAVKRLDRLCTGYMLQHLTMTLTPVSDRVVEDKESILSLDSKTFQNRTSRTGSCKVGLSVKKTNKTSVTWSNQDQITKGWGIELGVDVEGSYKGVKGTFKGKGSYNQSTTTTSGMDEEYSEEITVGSDCEMSVPIPPRQMGLATLRAVRRKIKVQVKYNVDVCGNVAGVYGTDRQPQTLKMSDVLEAGGKSNRRQVTEIIEIDCYTNCAIDIEDDYYDSG